LLGKKKEGETMDQDQGKAMYDNADKFIDLANEMSKTVDQGQVGVALRYAAARYSAYEASQGTNNLAENKDRHLQFFVETFTEMLQKNLDEYIEILARRKSS
jgi:hypothetical protein